MKWSNTVDNFIVYILYTKKKISIMFILLHNSLAVLSLGSSR